MGGGKKREAFWFKYFWGAKRKQKHRRRAVGGGGRCSHYLPKKHRGEKREPVLGSGEESSLLALLARADSKEREGCGGGDYHWPVQTQCSKNYTVRLKDARSLKSPNLKIQFEHSREDVFTL